MIADQDAAGAAARRFQHQKIEDGGADHEIGRQQRDLIGDGFVTPSDVTADQDGERGEQPIEPAHAPAGDEDERERKAERNRQHLLGVEARIEQPPRQIEHPADDAD